MIKDPELGFGPAGQLSPDVDRPGPGAWAYIGGMKLRTWVCAACLLAPAAAAGQGPVFRAGAARIDITPPLDPPLPMAGYPGRQDGAKSIHDNLYVRAIALDDGSAKAAIVTADLIGFSHAFCGRVAERVSHRSGVPAERLLIAGTHTHGGPAPRDGLAYTTRVEESMAEAVAQAFANLKPARAAFGAGRVNLNMNRRALFWDGRWWLGFNPEGPSDKTVGVVKFAAEDGAPIAILMNYGVHGTSMGQDNQAITADNPGAASRYVEQHYGDRTVAVWTSGAAGDQAPLYDRAPKSFTGVLNMGRLLGDEVIRVAESAAAVEKPRIAGDQKTIRCPGRKLAPGSSFATGFRFVDADPVEIRLSRLRIGKLSLAGISGEVFSLIGQKVKAGGASMVITHCNGSSGYIPNDDAYAQVSYEIQVTRLKPGCAEGEIVTALAGW